MRISDWSSDVCSSDLHILCREDLAICGDRHVPVGVVASLRNDRALVGQELQLGRTGERCGVRRHLQPVAHDIVVSHVDGERPETDDDRQDERRNRSEGTAAIPPEITDRSEEHTSELQSLMRISYAVICLKKKKRNN